jgi:regulatory protein
MLQATTDRPSPRGSARAAALRALAARRLTETQLWERLTRKGFADGTIRDAIEMCKRDGYVDDALFAQLYVDGRRKAVGDSRLVAELVKRGIDRDAAQASVMRAAQSEDTRIEVAIESLYRRRPELGYPNAARALERLGFPAPSIYRHLRARAAAEFEDCEQSRS